MTTRTQIIEEPVAYPDKGLIEEWWDAHDRKRFDPTYPSENWTEVVVRRAIDWHRNQQASASKEVPADVLAVLDELEKGALRKHAPGCFSLTDDACCTCYVGKDNTKVRTLTAKIRSLLGGEV